LQGRCAFEEAYEADPAHAAAEYGAEFRTDVETYVAREVVDAAVVTGRYELPPVRGIHYVAFTDPSGGSADAMTLAVAHRDRDGRAIIDALRERRPPFAPESVVYDFAKLMKSYRIHSVMGDRYGTNTGTAPDRLISGSSDAAPTFEVHEMSMDNGCSIRLAR
jgi:hypothetical protein